MSKNAKYMCRFTRELDEKLIELVSENEVLYDTSHQYYKDLNVRDDVWLAISSIVGKSVTQCKTRWRSLRDLYHRKKKEQRQGKKTRTPWEYMDAMNFLEEFTTEKKNIPADLTNDNEEDSKIDIKLEFDPDTPTTSQDVQPSPPKKLKTEDHYSHHHHFQDSLAILHMLREIRDMAKSKEDPTVAFFDSMAKTVVKFPPAQAAEVKLKVCQIVTEMECKIIEESGNYPDNLEEFD